jgi:hypothetical protein
MNARMTDLTETLRAAWSWDDLAEYGDGLLTAGDPRGELIALDLAPQPADQTWRERRTGALARWLGATAPRDAPLVHYGFIFELRTSVHPLAALDGAAGRFVRSCTLSGTDDRRAAARRALASAPRPWLVRNEEDRSASWTEVRTALETIEICSTLHELDTGYRDYFEGEPLISLTIRMAAAGLVELVGPCARLTSSGVARLRRLPSAPVDAPRMASSGKWVLFLGGEQVALVYLINDGLHHALAHLALPDAARDALVAFLFFLEGLLAVGEGVDVPFTGDCAALGAALAMIEELRLLGDDQPENPCHQHLYRLLATALAAPVPFVFRLSWGF